MANKHTIKFRLTRGRTPVNWQLPLTGMMLQKEGSLGLKKVHYIKGVDSIFVDDYDGDEKPQQIWFEDGLFEANKYDLALMQILKRHPMYGREYEMVDEDATAQKELEEFETIEKALAKVNIVNDDAVKANGLVILGQGSLPWSAERVRAALKKKAMKYESAKDLLKEMNSGDFHAKYAGALAILKGILVINNTRTAVTWPDGKVVVTVPAGQDPIERLTNFLSGSDELAKITLQDIGEKSKRAYVRKPEPVIEEVVSEALGTNTEVEDDGDGTEIDLEEAREMYKEIVGNDVPNNKKNDLDWILTKIDEK